MSELTSVQISKQASSQLKDLASKFRRSKTAQLEWLIDIEHKRHFKVASTSILPCPPDCEPVTVLNVISTDKETIPEN